MRFPNRILEGVAVDNIHRDITLLTNHVVEIRRTMFALVAALTNQPSIDRPRLSQDFVTTFRLSGGDPDRPSAETAALLKLLQIPVESTPQLSIAERLLRAGV